MKMKHSAILKWASNTKLLTNGKHSEGKDKKWIHSPDTLLKGHVVYLVKFLGNTEVDKPKGIDIVKQGIQKLKFIQQLKKSEGTGSSKTPKVELTISVDGVAIQDPKTKKISHQYPLHKISYCADDKAEKRFFSFIAKEGESDKHTCFVFVSDKLAEEITLTIGQAFELAYKKFLDTSGKDLELKKQLIQLHKRVEDLENKNVTLKKRLKEVADLKGTVDVQQYMKKNGIKDLYDDETDSGVTSSGSEDANTTKTSGDSPSCHLISLDTEFKLDGLSLEDLNDEDFNPRGAGVTQSDSSSDDFFDFNPRENEMSTPQAPPSLPPRDPNKIQGTNNPFLSSAPNGPADPFGMSSFEPLVPTGMKNEPLMPNFSLEALDPLKQ